MFKVDWKEVADAIATRLHDNNVRNLVLKMRADAFLIYVSQGDNSETAWKKADDLVKFFETKVRQ
jgi:hypothetical protein